MLLIVAFYSNLNAQPYFHCSTKPSTTSLNQATSQPSTCTQQLLDDLAPKPNDRILEVNVYFWVFAPTTNSTNAAWTNAAHPMSQSLLQQCLDGANSTYTNIPAIPQLTVTGTPTNVTNAKIKFVLKGWQIIHNDLAYKNIIQVAWGNLGSTWNDLNAINIYLGTNSVVNTYTDYTTTPPTTYTLLEEIENIASNGNPGGNPGVNPPDNTIHFTPAFHKSNTSPVYDYIELYGDVLAHELSHMLGLWHTSGMATTNTTCCTYVEPISFITPTFGCCNYQECNDYVIEHYPCNSSTATTGCKIAFPHQSCNTPGASDNLMSQNSACNRYLSPQQMGVMHYNLRTNQSHFLATSSYSAAFYVNTSLNYSVTSHETWDYDRYFKGNVIVKSDKTLTIKCVVAMSKGAKIVVEPGAQLIIDGGTVTNISGLLWDGIYIQGDPNQAQLISNTSNPGAVLYQGMLRIKNNGCVSHAMVGARNYLTSTGNTGGVIIASNAKFENNVRDVYMSRPASAVYQASGSWFANCSFITTGTISGSYQPTHHVELRNVTGVKFYGCLFKSTANPYTGGNGIFSVDASYIVDENGSTPTVFENLVRGVWMNNMNPLRTANISNCSFLNNTDYGAYFMNTNYLAFQTNTMTCVGNSIKSQVYLNNCKYYKIKGNDISHSTTYSASDEGISVYKSKVGAHEIYRNSFSNLIMGINCMDDNGNPNPNIPDDGLKMNCNDFHNNPNSYDVVLSYSSGLSIPRVNTNQGEISFQANAYNVARNIYGASCGNENKWQIYSGSTVTINHGSNTNTLTAVTQPTSTGCKSTNLNVVDMGISLNYPIHCSLNTPSSGGTNTTSASRVSAMNDHIGDLLDIRADVILASGTPNDFELQSTVASKLNIYLSDSTIADPDTVIRILASNDGFMEDADIQTVFAQINKGDFDAAQDLTDLLGSNRADWKSLLTQFIDFEQDTVHGIDSIGATYVSFFDGYAYSSDKDGKALAQALLYASAVSAYDEPHALPENYSSRPSGIDGLENTSAVNANGSIIKVFPNPTKNGVQLNYQSSEQGDIKVEIKDLLGKEIYIKFISGNPFNEYISLEQFQNGMYFLNLTNGNEIIFSSKLLKQD